MASVRFTASSVVRAPIDVVWATATHWPSHGRWVPLTVVTTLDDHGGLGTRFVGRTAIGTLGFDDPMTVTTWQPPASGATTAHCEVTKTGRVLTGTAGFTLTALDENSTRVDWFEDVDVAPAWLTRPFARLVAAISAAGLKQSLRKLAADAEKL